MKYLFRIALLLTLLLALTSQVLADPPVHTQKATPASPQQPPNPLKQPATTSAYGMDILGPAWQWTFPRESAHPRFDGDMRIDQLDEVLYKSWSAGVRSARVAAWWCFLEPERDQYEWEDMDIMLQLLSNYGIEPVPEILYTPYWARAAAPAPQTSCIDNWQRNYRPDDMADWEQFMGEIVQRYGASGKKQVRYWEIWNEPDLPEFLSREGSGDDETVCIYSELLKAASRQIRSRDPEARILLGGLSDINGPGFLDDLLDAKCSRDVRDDFDILAFHAFTSHDLKLYFLKHVLEKYDAVGRYELWLNEFNNIKWGKDYGRADREIDDLFDLMMDADVTRTFWFKSWTTKWQADWTVGIFEDRDPLWVPGPFTPSPFYDSFQRRAFPHRLPGAPNLTGPAAIAPPRPTFTWSRPSPGSFPLAGYKLQVDDSTYQGTPYFHAPEIDVWVTASNTHFLPFQINAGSSATAARSTTAISAFTNLSISNLSYQTPQPLTPGRYFWRVAAVDTEGNVGPYSEIRILYISPGDKRSFLPMQLH